MQRVIRLRLLSSMALEVKIGPQRKTFRAAKLLRHPIIGSFHTATVRPDVKLFFFFLDSSHVTFTSFVQTVSRSGLSDGYL